MDERFELVLELFHDYLEHTGEVCVAKTRLYGYVILGSAADDVIYESHICETPQILFNRLLNEWETEVCFQAAKENGMEDFVSLYEGLDKDQLKVIRQKKCDFYKKSVEILENV